MDFRPYRFSPILSKQDLFATIEHIHFACHQLSMNSFGRYLSVAGNVGVFCHYDEEFEQLLKIRNKLTKPTNNPDLKYYELLDPIVIPTKNTVPGAAYTHLYIRKPDPYRYQTGDIDFYLPLDEYNLLKANLASGYHVAGARIFERPDLDMIELYHPDIDALGYITTHTMTEKVRIKLSDATKL